MKLYEINELLKRCIKVDENYIVDGETGEIIDLDAIDALVMEREDKIINIARWIKELTAEAEAIKAEKMKLAKRQSATENKAESLKEYLEKILNVGENVSDATTEIKWRKSTVCEADVDVLRSKPEYAKYLTYAEPKANKTEITAALKKGIEIEGCQLVEKQNMRIV